MKVLVVEDRIENTLAALKFFDGEDIPIEIASTVKDAIQKLHEEIFGAAVLDVEIPMFEGAPVEGVGHEVGKIAKDLEVPYVYLTGGYYHHDRPEARVFINEVCLKANQGDSTPEKTDPGAWAKAWEALQSMGNLEEIYEARVRYKKYTGKMYHRA